MAKKPEGGQSGRSLGATFTKEVAAKPKTQMEEARKIMEKRRNALRELAK